MKITRVFICLMGLLLGGFILTAPCLAKSQARPPGKPAIYEFGRQTCPVCQRMAGILRDIEAIYPGQITVRFLYIETDEPLFTKYRVSIVPTQVFLDASGREVSRHEGPFSRETLVNQLKELKFIKD